MIGTRVGLNAGTLFYPSNLPSGGRLQLTLSRLLVDTQVILGSTPSATIALPNWAFLVLWARPWTDGR